MSKVIGQLYKGTAEEFVITTKNERVNIDLPYSQCNGTWVKVAAYTDNGFIKYRVFGVTVAIEEGSVSLNESKHIERMEWLKSLSVGSKVALHGIRLSKRILTVQSIEEGILHLEKEINVRQRDGIADTGCFTKGGEAWFDGMYWIEKP